MRVAIEKIEGVKSAQVSLNRGVALVTFEPDNAVSIARVRDAIRSNGFTPKAAELSVEGRIVDEGGELILALPGVHRGFRLVAHPETPEAAPRIRELGLGKIIVIEGVVPETARKDQGSEVIQVRRFSLPR